MTFVQASPPVPGTDGVTHDGITCFGCNNTGHYRNKCPSSNIQLMQFSGETTTLNDKDIFVDFGSLQTVVLTSHEDTPQDTTSCDISRPLNLIPSYLILLDSESTVCVFDNPSFVLDIRPSANRSIVVHTNGGTQQLSLVGDTKYLQEVWYNPDSIVNILSLSTVSNIYRITMDSSISHAMHEISLVVSHNLPRNA